ncbi:hypothetical protein [Streptomyces sp. NPDC002851]
MSYNAQIETREIADDALDGVAGGAHSGLSLASHAGHLQGVGGVELAGHGVVSAGAVNLNNGHTHLNVASF